MKFHDKKILVTGADGFIGSHLVESLLESGCENIKALSFYNSFNSWGWLEDINQIDKIEIVTGDIRDPDYVRFIMKDIDIVFHLAALIAIPYSYTAPNSYIQTNVIGTANIMKAALENDVERILHTSTSEVYGSAKYVPIDEKHPLQPQSPYSASKIAADAIAESFFHSFQLPLTIVRPFNTYGPRQSARAVIPTVITQILSGKSEIQLGSLHPTRDFNYVKDTCRGFTQLAECKEAIGEIINIGSDKEIRIDDTVKLIAEIMAEDVKIVTENQRLRPKNSEVERLRCDNTKIRSFINYQPEESLRSGLKKTIDWLSKERNLMKYKTNIYNV
jgi:NAD dependent epimerase/dehydratase